MSTPDELGPHKEGLKPSMLARQRLDASLRNMRTTSGSSSGCFDGISTERTALDGRSTTGGLIRPHEAASARNRRSHAHGATVPGYGGGERPALERAALL